MYYILTFINYLLIAVLALGLLTFVILGCYTGIAELIKFITGKNKKPYKKIAVLIDDKGFSLELEVKSFEKEIRIPIMKKIDFKNESDLDPANYIMEFYAGNSSGINTEKGILKLYYYQK